MQRRELPLPRCITGKPPEEVPQGEGRRETVTRGEKDQGCTMLFLNPRGEVLMLLRDDKPGIPYPNMWDLPGGHLE